MNQMSKEAFDFRGKVLAYCMKQGLTSKEITEKLNGKELLKQINALCEAATILMSGDKSKLFKYVK